MGFFSFIKTPDGASDEMARKVRELPQSSSAVVATYVERLKSARIDVTAFDAVFDELASNPQLTAPEIIEIANTFAAVGLKAASKKAALAKIKTRFVELGRQAAKNKDASKARPW